MSLSISVSRRLREHRSIAILAALVVLCLISLAAGARAALISDALRTGGSVVAYPVWKALTAIQSGAGYAAGFALDYGKAHREAEALREQLVDTRRYMAAYAELRQENERLRANLGFMRNEPRLTVEAAEVIGRSFDGALTIDRGAVHGVRESMCVLTGDGVVGIVANVEPFFSHVYTLHHSNCKVGAMVARNRVRGVVHGSGSTVSPVASMQYIDLKDDIRPGDAIITSGGGIFPSGYPIGVVSKVEYDSGSLLKTAIIEPAVDPYRLDEVFVLRAAHPSAGELAGPQGRESEPASPLYAMPDERSLQERYAP